MSKKTKKKQRIRPLALCVFRCDGKIFVARGYDSHLDQSFYRPIGGRIEFGERGHETVIREVKEELDAEVTNVRYLGLLENIFTYQGAAGHEIALIYDGRFTDPKYNQGDARICGKDSGEILYEARWMSPASFRDNSAPPLYPNGLLDLLDSSDTG